MSAFSFGSRTMCADCEKQTAPYREKYADLHHEDAGAEGLVTKGLVVLNVLMFGAMVFNGVPPTQPSGADLFRWGSEFGPATLGAQPWRLVTCMFLHIGLIHLGFNMWCLWDLGQVAERIFGRAWFLALYLVSGICGSYVSLLWDPLRNSAGASGAIFGVAGALIAAFKFGHLAFDPTRVRAMLRSVTLFAIYNLLFGLAGGINNMAHLGGLVGGFTIGFLLTRMFPPYSETYERSFWWLTPILALGLVGAFFGLRNLKADQLALGQGALAAEAGDCNVAVPQLERAVQAHADDPDAHVELGYCYEKLARQGDAQREYERALGLGGDNPYAHQQLGWMAEGRQDYAAMEKHFRAALKAEPEDAELNRGLASALLHLNRTAEALPYAEKAVAAEPRDPNNQEALAAAYMQAGRYQDALKPLQQAAELAPQEPRPHQQLADVFDKLGDAKSAAAERARAAQLEAQQEK